MHRPSDVGLDQRVIQESTTSRRLLHSPYLTTVLLGHREEESNPPTLRIIVVCDDFCATALYVAGYQSTSPRLVFILISIIV